MIPQKYIDEIKSGGIVAFPTETVYGLGADAKNLAAIKKIFYAKGRPSDNPLIVHIADSEHWKDFAVEIPDEALLLARTFWPGPLTIVLKKKPEVLDAITAGMDSVAVRMPRHPLALELIKKCGPLVAPSANISGRPSPTKAQHVVEDFGNTIPVIDGGSTEVGLESTVIDLTTDNPIILRPGVIGKYELREVLKKDISIAANIEAKPKSPGQKYSHYQPNAEVAWVQFPPVSLDTDTLYLLQQEMTPAKNVVCYYGDLNLLARELYDRFRQADSEGYTRIKIENIEPFSEQPVYAALINRITKACGKG